MMLVPESETTIAESETSSEPEPVSTPEGNSAPGTVNDPEFEPTAESYMLSSMSSQPEAEGTSSEPEVGGNSRAEAEPVLESVEAEGWPEVGPEWAVAKSEWEEAWPFHVYFFSMAFLLISLLAAYIAVSSLLQHKGPRSSMNKTTITLTLMIWSFTLSRALFLLADPYFSEDLLPFVAARLLWSFGIPGFTASFSIMLLILLDTTKMSLAPPRFQNVGTVMVIWLLHVLIVLVTDLLVMYVRSDVRPLLVMCQMLFVLYGVLVAVGYAYVGVKMRGNLQASSQGHNEDDQTKKIRRLVAMTFLSSVVALCVAAVNVYTAFSEFGPYTKVVFIQPWPYWSVQTFSRSLEVAACSLVLVLFFRSGKGGQSKILCEQCHLWRKRQQSICPEPVSGKSKNVTTEVTGLQWRLRSDSIIPCPVQQ